MAKNVPFNQCFFPLLLYVLFTSIFLIIYFSLPCILSGYIIFLTFWWTMTHRLPAFSAFLKKFATLIVTFVNSIFKGLLKQLMQFFICCYNFVLPDSNIFFSSKKISKKLLFFSGFFLIPFIFYYRRVFVSKKCINYVNMHQTQFSNFLISLGEFSPSNSFCTLDF